MKSGLSFCLLLLALSLTACSSGPEEANASTQPIPVILDTDIGGDIDDTWALAHLLRSPELDVKLITTSTGNPAERARIAAKLLEVAGRTDIPLGIGIEDKNSDIHHEEWLGDYQLSDYPGETHQDGVDALIRTIHESPSPVTLIVIGEATNIAEALRRDPSIAPKTRFIGMHGSIDVGYGGRSTPSAESNVKNAVPAFRDVLEADWREILLTPLDTCGIVVVDGENYQRLFNADDPLLQALFENYDIWADNVPWTTVDYFETRSSTLFDIVAIYMAYDTSLLEFETIPLSVTDSAMTIRDPQDGHPVQAAMDWKDLEAFYDHVTQRLLPNQP